MGPLSRRIVGAVAAFLLLTLMSWPALAQGRPHRRLDQALVERAKTAGTSRVESQRGGAHEATALLGPTRSDKYDLQAEGIASKCVTPAKGPSKRGTLIDRGRLQGTKLPEYPEVNHQVPLRDGAYAVLNKQVRTAEGYAVIGAQFVDRDGRTTDLAKTRCVTPKKMMSAQRRALSR